MSEVQLASAAERQAAVSAGSAHLTLHKLSAIITSMRCLSPLLEPLTRMGSSPFHQRKRIPDCRHVNIAMLIHGQLKPHCLARDRSDLLPNNNHLHSNFLQPDSSFSSSTTSLLAHKKDSWRLPQASKRPLQTEALLTSRSASAETLEQVKSSHEELLTLVCGTLLGVSVAQRRHLVREVFELYRTH